MSGNVTSSPSKGPVQTERERGRESEQLWLSRDRGVSAFREPSPQ